MKKVLIIDANSLIYRAYHALPPLRTTGQLVNAVYGFFLMFTKTIEELKPDFVFAAFDRKEKTFRHKKFKDYKAQRPAMPDDLVSQIPLIKEGLKNYAVPCLEKKGFEADDIIATLSEWWKKEFKIVILSGDRDLLQLVEDNISVLAPGRGIKKMINFDKQMVVKEYGVTPEKFVDYKALRGDPSDNIPGVKGIGKKGAMQLVSRYGTVEDIFNALSEIQSNNLRNKLKHNKEEALQSKELVSLIRNIDLDVKLEDGLYNISYEKVLSFFQKFNFNRLAEKYTKQDQMKLDF